MRLTFSALARSGEQGDSRESKKKLKKLGCMLLFGGPTLPARVDRRVPLHTLAAGLVWTAT